MKEKLLIVCPVYNEEECVKIVTKEWMDALYKLDIDFKFLYLNDGSTDNTQNTIKELKISYPELDVINKPNSGHGQTCIFGYKIAVKENYDWVFQIDSDGQCDPKYFKEFWDLRNQHDIIFGNRITREDGFFRVIISIFLKLTILIALKQYVIDANVPYRLIKTDKLKENLDKIPNTLNLANMFLSILLNFKYQIKWVRINFRDRVGGSPKVKPIGFAKHGINVYKDLRGLKFLFR